jgi:hypothetical protein
MVSFGPLLKVLVRVDAILCLSLIQQVEHKFGSSLMHVQIVFENTWNSAIGNFQHVSSFLGSDFSVSRQVPSLDPHFHMLCSLMAVLSISHL